MARNPHALAFRRLGATQETDRRLREEQDAEYQRSLEADRQVGLR